MTESERKKLIKASKKQYLAIAKAAGVPLQFRLVRDWRTLSPEVIRISDAVFGGRSIRVPSESQQKWITDLLKYRAYRRTGCIVIFGDYLADSAEKVAYGIFCHAIRHGVAGKVLHPVDLTKGPARELDGKETKYQIILLNRIHSDDEGQRRGLIRDFVNKHYQDAFKILVVYGESAIDFFYKKIGLNPQAIFFFPYQGKAEIQPQFVSGVQEH